MKIDVITSFNQRYYDLIGKDCVQTWLKYWPHDMILTCYVEEMSVPKHDRVQQIDFQQLDPDYFAFQKTDFKSRVHVFAKKAYAVIHAMYHSTADRIIWIDADVLTTKPVNASLLASVLPDSVVSTHLGVSYNSTKNGTVGNWFVPETGFFALNTGHTKFTVFREQYTRRYRERDFAGLRRSYDNDVYGAVIREHNIPSLDLCADLKKCYKTPLRHTVLGDYLCHYKAKHSKDQFADNQ